MIKKTIFVIVVFFCALSVKNISAAQTYSERITPNKLTIQREDGNKVTIDAFRIRGYNVAQLRTLVGACGGSVVSVVNDAGYQIVTGPNNIPFTPVSFSGTVTVNVQFNVTEIKDKTGKYIKPGEPGWVFLTDYNYNWGSIRDVLTAMGYEIKSFSDNAKNASTSVVIGQIVKTAPGMKEFPTPSGFVGTCPVYIYYEEDLKPSIPAGYTIRNFSDPDYTGERIWIYARDGIKEVRVDRIDFSPNSEGFTASVNKQLYTTKLASNEVLVLNTMIPDVIPLTAVTFIGNDGKAYSFLLCCDGRTGLDNALKVDLTSTQPVAGIAKDDKKSDYLITAAGSVDLTGMNLYWQEDNLQFSDDSKAKLSLYVNAEKNDKGNFALDDGNYWLLLYETSFGTYPLFPRKYVQLGGVHCSVFNDAEGKSHVLVTVRQTAGYLIYDCIFENDAKVFHAKTVYEASGINLII